ncbi:MAG: hypothetical protein II956_00615 [Bacteroidales bacterium]|nr:hypothetical protein [Bacteroidales bacterium]
MDIQAIIKQVLSLADLVIKNPSTSVKSSGIDLSSLIQMAGGLLGGSNSGQQQSSGGSALGSILGGVVASGALGGLLGGSNSNQQQQQQESSAGSALGSILGSAISSGALGGLLGGGSQQQQSQQQSSGGLGDLLGQLTSRAGTITNMLNGSNSSNLSSDQKTNLGDVLNIVNIAKGFIK